MAHVLTSFVVFLTSGNKPLTKDISRKNLNLKESNVGIFWQAFYNKLLPKPFETMCVNYSKLGLLSQGDCFEKCLINSFHNKTNGTRMPPGVRVLKDDAQNIKKRFVNVDELSLKLGSSNETWRITLKKMGTICEEKCEHHDCKSITYNPITLDKFNTTHPTFILMMPYTPTIGSISLPSVSLIQFLTDFVSALGFWLGVSAFGLFDQSKDAMNSVAKKLRNKNQVQSITYRELQKRISDLTRRLEHLNHKVNRMSVRNGIENMDASQSDWSNYIENRFSSFR